MAVIIATTRIPALPAKQLSTLDVLNEGRLIVGTALGGRPWTYPLFGALYDRTDMGSDMAVWSSVEQCVEGLMEVVETGAGMLMLDPVFDHEEQLERLASEVAPKLGPPISG